MPPAKSPKSRATKVNKTKAEREEWCRVLAKESRKIKAEKKAKEAKKSKKAKSPKAKSPRAKSPKACKSPKKTRKSKKAAKSPKRKTRKTCRKTCGEDLDFEMESFMEPTIGTLAENIQMAQSGPGPKRVQFVGQNDPVDGVDETVNNVPLTPLGPVATPEVEQVIAPQVESAIESGRIEQVLAESTVPTVEEVQAVQAVQEVVNSNDEEEKEESPELSELRRELNEFNEMLPGDIDSTPVESEPIVLESVNAIDTFSTMRESVPSLAKIFKGISQGAEQKPSVLQGNVAWSSSGSCDMSTFNTEESSCGLSDVKDVKSIKNIDFENSIGRSDVVPWVTSSFNVVYSTGEFISRILKSTSSAIAKTPGPAETSIENNVHVFVPLKGGEKFLWISVLPIKLEENQQNVVDATLKMISNIPGSIDSNPDNVPMINMMLGGYASVTSHDYSDLEFVHGDLDGSVVNAVLSLKRRQTIYGLGITNGVFTLETSEETMDLINSMLLEGDDDEVVEGLKGGLFSQKRFLFFLTAMVAYSTYDLSQSGGVPDTKEAFETVKSLYEQAKEKGTPEDLKEALEAAYRTVSNTIVEKLNSIDTDQSIAEFKAVLGAATEKFDDVLEMIKLDTQLLNDTPEEIPSEVDQPLEIGEDGLIGGMEAPEFNPSVGMRQDELPQESVQPAPRERREAIDFTSGGQQVPIVAPEQFIGGGIGPSLQIGS